MTKEEFTLPSGRKVVRVYIKGNHVTVKLLSLGATVEDVIYDGTEGSRHMILGYGDKSLYETNPYYFGACVARVGNRIGGARFTLNGQVYELEKNDGNNNLHSGRECLCFRDWKIHDISERSVAFEISSPDGDMGFPGKMTIRVRYTVTENDALIIDYEGQSDKDTIFNPTNHSYFNLGEDPTILSEMLKVDAECFTPGGKESIPDGTVSPVEGTPMDFRSFCRIGDRIDADFDELKYTGGYDHNYVLIHDEVSEIYSLDELKVYFAAELKDEKSGRGMKVFTSLPGMQVYTGNFLKGDVKDDSGRAVSHRGGVCLETQYFPNAINVPGFIQPVSKANEITRSRTVYQFS